MTATVLNVPSPCGLHTPYSKETIAEIVEALKQNELGIAIEIHDVPYKLLLNDDKVMIFDVGCYGQSHDIKERWDHIGTLDLYGANLEWTPGCEYAIIRLLPLVSGWLDFWCNR